MPETLSLPKWPVLVGTFSLVLTALFHLLVLDAWAGIGFGLFIIILVIAIQGLAMYAKLPTNRWAYIFLIPLGAVACAEMLYSSEVVAVFGLLLLFACGTLFAYWLTAPGMPWPAVQRLWPRAFLREGVLPIASPSQSLLTGLPRLVHGKRILMGCLLALPFLFLLVILFSSADPLFNRAITEFFRVDWIDPVYIRWLVIDLVFFVYTTRMAWLFLTRAKEDRRPTFEATQISIDPITLSTALVLLNGLFLAFLLVQFRALFGGEGWVETMNLTYAEYARRGFFELIATGAIAGLVGCGVYFLTEMRLRVSRWLTVTLIVQTLLVLASAGKRLWLYVDAYGLTVSRWWAMLLILFVALAFGLFLSMMLRGKSYAVFVKTGVIASLLFFAGTLVINTESIVARWNVDRFLKGEKGLDVVYLNRLSSDAAPERRRLLVSAFPDSSIVVIYDYDERGSSIDTGKHMRILVRNKLRDEEVLLREKKSDWWGAIRLTISDYRALSLD